MTKISGILQVLEDMQTEKDLLFLLFVAFVDVESCQGKYFSLQGTWVIFLIQNWWTICQLATHQIT